MAERHISTPWRGPDDLRQANVDNVKLERGHGRDPSSAALIRFLPRESMTERL
jgi:hypothetical protein